MAIVVGSGKQALGSEMGGVVDSGHAFSRVEALITARELKDKYLFGIPMYSFLPDPVTRKRAEYTPDLQKEAIRLAVNKVELLLGIEVSPVIHQRRLPFDRNEYFSLGYFQLPNKPITEVISLCVRPAGASDPNSQQNIVYNISPDWIDNANLQRGQVNIIPLMPASVGGMLPLPSPGQGGNAFLTIIGSLWWVPAFWEMTYVSGFKEGRVPAVVNNLIGLMAAADVLGDLGATNRIANYNVSLDGASQSVNTGGTNVYADRIKDLTEEAKVLMNKLKKKFGMSIFSSNL